MDNAPVNWSKRLKKLAEKCGAYFLFNVPNFPMGNPIENLFELGKRDLRKVYKMSKRE